MKHLYIYICMAAALAATPAHGGDKGRLGFKDVRVVRAAEKINVNVDLVLDSLKLGRNNQIFVSPAISDGTSQVVLPAVLVNGRNMHIAYERGTIAGLTDGYDIAQEVKRDKGAQTVHYVAAAPFEKWMLSPDAELKFLVDTCGCGHAYAGSVTGPTPLGLNPVGDMRLVYITPKVTELPVAIHEGKARVQFEVDKTELHTEPYRCASGQRIDNREQLQAINDTVSYALSDPNVEIATINITGYASPESPYTHNEYLATGRSKSLAEYLGAKYNLPAEARRYGSVPENWEEFREMVVNAGDITDAQRTDLLQLIDRPAYGPSDYDAKETELKTSPKFAQLYRTKILPKWFPLLRATKFTITTHLRPLSDEQLAEVIETSPQLMSLNQMFRVARLYAEGSDDFNRIIDIALRYYPDDPVANTNAAIAALSRGDLDTAESLLQKAGDSQEAENARGILAARRSDLDEALRRFIAAGNLPEAVRNRQLIGNE